MLLVLVKEGSYPQAEAVFPTLSHMSSMVSLARFKAVSGVTMVVRITATEGYFANQFIDCFIETIGMMVKFIVMASSTTEEAA